MTKQWPSISVVTPTYNSGKTLDRCLRLVREQNYPQEKIEIILGDGGSKDTTEQIAKKYKAKVIHVPSNKQNAEYNRGTAFNKANNELVLILDHDNFLPYKNWLRDMVTPLLENPNMVATSTCYFDYKRDYDLLDRYFALFGASEPLPYYLGKTDRMLQTSKNWHGFGKVQDRGKYFLIEFDNDPRKFPSVGTNGCLMRKNIVYKHSQHSPEYHYPIDVLFDVVTSGHNQFGFVKNSIIHLTHSRGLVEFIKRKYKFVEQYYFKEISRRRWAVVMPGDGPKVAVFVIYSLTFVKPLYDSLVGYLKIRDLAWFVNPIMCLATTVIYGFVTLKYKTFRFK